MQLRLCSKRARCNLERQGDLPVRLLLFKVNNGRDYGSLRVGMNTFDFITLTLPKHEKVTSKICFDENGKQVCR